MGVSGFYVALIHPFCVDFGRIGLYWMLFAKIFSAAMLYLVSALHVMLKMLFLLICLCKKSLIRDFWLNLHGISMQRAHGTNFDC